MRNTRDEIQNAKQAIAHHIEYSRNTNCLHQQNGGVRSSTPVLKLRRAGTEDPLVASFTSILDQRMYSYNRVHIIGYQTQPIELRQTPSGTSVTDLNLVVPSTFRSENGERVMTKAFCPVTVWGPTAEFAAQFVRPGMQIFISGRLQTDSWDDQQTGEKRSKTKIVALDMILLDPKDGQRPAPEGAPQTAHCLNQAHVLGNVTRDPELRTTTGGQKVLTLGIATNDRWKDKGSGEERERTEFHNVVIWGDLADEVNRVMRKGNRVYASGRVQTRSWETQDGSKRWTTEIIADRVLLLGIENTIAKESVTTESFRRPEKTMSADEDAQGDVEVVSKEAEDAFEEAQKNPVAAGVKVPSVQYTSEVKVEDLPF